MMAILWIGKSKALFRVFHSGRFFIIIPRICRLSHHLQIAGNRVKVILFRQFIHNFNIIFRKHIVAVNKFNVFAGRLFQPHVSRGIRSAVRAAVVDNNSLQSKEMSLFLIVKKFFHAVFGNIC